MWNIEFRIGLYTYVGYMENVFFKREVHGEYLFSEDIWDQTDFSFTACRIALVLFLVILTKPKDDNRLLWRVRFVPWERVDAPLTKETRAFPREIRTRFPVRETLVGISISLRRQSLPITPRACNSRARCPLIVPHRARPLSLLRQLSTSGFPVPVLQRGLVVMARVSSTGSRNMAEYLFSRRLYVGYNRGYFPVPQARALMRNNAMCSCAERQNHAYHRSFEFYRNN